MLLSAASWTRLAARLIDLCLIAQPCAVALPVLAGVAATASVAARLTCEQEQACRRVDSVAALDDAGARIAAAVRAPHKRQPVPCAQQRDDCRPMLVEVRRQDRVVRAHIGVLSHDCAPEASAR